jgi:hypothetical protein
MAEEVPTTRRQRLRQLAQNTDQGIQNRIRTRVGTPPPTESSIVQFLQRIVSDIERFFQILAFSIILIYQILKYACMVALGILAIIGGYFAFKYVLLFFIWVQHQLGW